MSQPIHNRGGALTLQTVRELMQSINIFSFKGKRILDCFGKKPPRKDEKCEPSLRGAALCDAAIQLLSLSSLRGAVLCDAAIQLLWFLSLFHSNKGRV
jgi:hypothetical protein